MARKEQFHVLVLYVIFHLYFNFASEAGVLVLIVQVPGLCLSSTFGIMVGIARQVSRKASTVQH